MGFDTLIGVMVASYMSLLSEVQEMPSFGRWELTSQVPEGRWLLSSCQTFIYGPSWTNQAAIAHGEAEVSFEPNSCLHTHSGIGILACVVMTCGES